MSLKPILLALLCISGWFSHRSYGKDPALFPVVVFGKESASKQLNPGEIQTGFIDASGKLAIPLHTNWWSRNDGATHFAEGLEPMQVKWQPGRVGIGQWGYLNAAGEFAIEPQFTLALPFAEGLAPVRDKNGKYGYIDHAGKYVIAPQFEEAFAFSEGLAQVVHTNHLMGFIDRTGQWIIKPQFPAFSPHSNFSGDLACVETNETPQATDPEFKWGYINKKGGLVTAFRFHEANEFSEGLAAVEENDRWGYLDKTGKLAIQPECDLAWNFSGGLARLRVRGKMVFINHRGQVAFTVPGGTWADEFSEGLANVSVGKPPGEEQWGYINQKGDFVIPPQFQRGLPFYHGLAQVSVGDQSGYIDKFGHFVWKQPVPNLWPATGKKP